jgi:hypothetical protein
VRRNVITIFVAVFLLCGVAAKRPPGTPGKPPPTPAKISIWMCYPGPSECGPRAVVRVRGLAETPGASGAGAVTSSDAGVKCPPKCTVPAAQGKMVRLAVQAKDDAYGRYRFVQWSGACRGQQSTCSTRVDGLTRVLAIFERAPAMRHGA